MIKPLLGLALLAAVAAPALAQEPLPPEEFTVKPAIDPGPNVFVYQMDLSGPGSIAVFDAGDLTLKGTMSSGAMGQMYVPPGAKTAYTMSAFMKRYTHGPMEQVLQIFDVDTLTPVREVVLPPKGAMALAYQPLLQESADGKYMFVQNATPASSITVVDLAAGTVAQEIPTPGCFGIYPMPGTGDFSTLCGDGSIMSYALGEGGKTAVETVAADIFDPDVDALFLTAARAEDGLVFVSFKGEVYRVADGPDGVKKTETFSMVEGVEGGWAPGGYQVVAYSPELKVLFVTMHSGAYEGSHKNPSQEIWAVDLAKKAVVGRAPLENVVSMTVGGGATPSLYTVGVDMKLTRFTVDLTGGLTLTPAGDTGVIGIPFLLAASR